MKGAFQMFIALVIATALAIPAEAKPGDKHKQLKKCIADAKSGGGGPTLIRAEVEKCKRK
ncbi:MAG: hypothetical protein D6773_00655 [Alphaproteobacteria bacterium]|nr:MAG: hypothetical protein D6773_00655 [Alphaproteobacteria bacterium]